VLHEGRSSSGGAQEAGCKLLSFLDRPIKRIFRFNLGIDDK